MKKSIFTFLFSLVISTMAFSQITGNKYIGDGLDYQDVKSAIQALNTDGVGEGGVTFMVPAGWVETFLSPTAGIINTTTGSATRPIVFKMDPATTGVKPVIIAATGTGVYDAIITIAGTDYVTFDGINLKESPANLGDNSRAEWGFAILKASGTDGSQNITIKNCAVRMDTNYAASIGIYSNNHLPGGKTQIAVTAFSGTNSNLKIFYDSISSYSSIYVSGFGDPVSPYSYYDQNNEIGVEGQNTITKVAGIDGNPGYGVYGRCQNNLKVANNRIGSIMGGTGTPFGIYLWHGKNSNFEVYNNYVSMVFSGQPIGTTAFNPIYCTMGAYGQGNTNSIYNNTVTGCVFSRMTTGQANFMNFDSLGTNVTFHDNNVTYNTVGNSTTVATGIIYYCFARKQTGSVMTGLFTMFNNTVSNNKRLQSVTGSGNTYLLGNRGTSTAVTCYNNLITDNIIGSNGSCYSLYSYGEGQKNFYDNTISNITKAEGTFYGFYNYPVISASGDQYFYRNKVTNIESNSASSTMYGIYSLTSGVSAYYYNNVFSDFRGTAASTTGSPAINFYGMYISQGSFVGLYNNTVFFNAPASSGTNFGTCAVYCGGTSILFDLRGNIFANNSGSKGTGKTIAFRYSGVPTTTFQSLTNNNLYYAGTPSTSNWIFYDGTNNYQTIAAYKAAVFPRESQTVSELPPFMNTTAGSVNVQIQAGIATQVESAGTVISTPVAITTDFWGDARYPNVGYPVNPTYPPNLPDIGADEFGGIPNDQTGPAISYTPLSNINHNNNRYLTVTITDGSGVPVSGAGMPMLYWKTQILPWVGVQGVFVSPGVYSFYFGGGSNITEGDVISYYVVAQDLWATPNLSCNPSIGASGFTANPPAVSTTPTTPNTYTILGNFSGTYHVGVGKDFTTLTLAVASLNSKWIYGPVLFYLDDNTYPNETYPITINHNPGSSAMNSVTIKPYTGATPVFTAALGGTGTYGFIRFNGIDYCTIDGTAVGNSGTRDLSFINTYTNGGMNAPQYGIYISATGTDAATNNTIKGCVIKCNVGTLTGFPIPAIYDIFFNNAAGPYDNTTIDNNWLKGAMYGIYHSGSASIAPSTNIQITNNRIGSETVADYIADCGINLYYANYPVISNNDISGPAEGNIMYSQAGIAIGNNVVGSKITGNKIHDFFRNTPASINCQGPVFGMYYNSTDATAVTEISNNAIYNIKWYGCSSIAGQSNLAGLFFRSGGNLKIIGNSINMTGAFLSGGAEADVSSTCMLFYYQANGGNIEIKNNIFRNGQTTTGGDPVYGKAYGIMTSLPVSYFNNINYNDYWIDGYNGHIAIYSENGTGISTYYPTLASWQTATGQEANSLYVNPMFTSDTDLLPTTGAMPHAGIYMPLAPKDITGANRSNPPDVGAYEFTINPGFTTTGYSSLTSSSVTLEGWVSSTNEGLDLFFDWGLTAAYGNTEVATPSTVASHVISTFAASLSTLSPGVTYHFRARGIGVSSGVIYYGSDFTFTTPALTKTLTLKLFLEGLYAGSGTMNQAQDEFGNHFGAGVADQVTVELHNTSNYSVVEYSAGLVNLSTSGNIVIDNLPVSITGSYFITVKNRNSIETTTGFPVSFAGNLVNFDFSTAAPQAYGANQKDVGANTFVFWSGDVNQDGIVDSGDLNLIDNASTAITIGYYPEDINGDGIVDSGDMNIGDNNSTAIIMALLP